jgi:hypothetical protein
MDYDTWKTTDPNADAEGTTLFVDVEDGQITFRDERPDSDGYLRETVEIDNEPDPETPEQDDARIVRELAVIRRRYDVEEMLLSSSVDFPEEYGVTRKINLRDLIRRSFEAGA